jgi:hypothetical protein
VRTGAASLEQAVRALALLYVFPGIASWLPAQMRG